MKFLKELWDNPLLKKLIIGTGIFLLILIMLMIFISCTSSGKIYTYEELEELFTNKVITKYTNNNNLPTENSRLEVNINEFITNKELKTINEYTGKTDNCSAKVTIYNNNNNYLYIPFINCSDAYKTKTLKNQIIEDSLTTSGNGLYEINNEYIFKGDNVNNYIKLDNKTYRILGINEDETIRLLEGKNKDRKMTPWDDRYNIDKEQNIGINNYYANNLNSRIKDTLEETYNKYNDNFKAYLIPSEYCVGKRSINEADNSGSIECMNKTEKYPVGILPLYEYFRASLDPNCSGITSESCTNYNYLSNINLGSYWTLTADKDTTHKVYKISNGKPMLSNANTSSYLKTVININPDLVLSSGDGTEENPYIIKEYK